MKKIILLLIPFFFLISSCKVQYVADYNERVEEEILKVYEDIERFYLRMSLVSENERTFNKFEADYLNIEISLQTLFLRNKIRPLNDESIKQTENIITLWNKVKEEHKNEDKVKSYILQKHRGHFQRMFIAMLIGEEKKL